MQLKEILLNTKAAWVEHPEIDGFEVEVVNLSRKELGSLRKRCVTKKFDRSTRQPEEVLDEDKFLTEFANAVIKDWKGLTLEQAQTLVLIDVTEEQLQQELPYSQENAKILVESSTEFDTWLNEVIFDLDNFRTKPKG